MFITPIKLNMIVLDIQGNELNCKWLFLNITIYHPGLISHSYENKIRLILYDELPCVDIYDSNIFL